MDQWYPWLMIDHNWMHCGGVPDTCPCYWASDFMFKTFLPCLYPELALACKDACHLMLYGESEVTILSWILISIVKILRHYTDSKICIDASSLPQIIQDAQDYLLVGFFSLQLFNEIKACWLKPAETKMQHMLSWTAFMNPLGDSCNNIFHNMELCCLRWACYPCWSLLFHIDVHMTKKSHWSSQFYM